MKASIMFLLAFSAIATLGFPRQGDSPELRQLSSISEQFQQPEMAQAAGYNFFSGLENCNLNLGGAGYPYVNIGLIDTTVDLLQPEVLIYVPTPNGTLQLGAVEYIVPVNAWNDTHKDEWPRLMEQQFHLNSTLGAYVLHVWVWQENPSGMFEDWNPKVACNQLVEKKVNL